MRNGGGDRRDAIPTRRKSSAVLAPGKAKPLLRRSAGPALPDAARRRLTGLRSGRRDDRLQSNTEIEEESENASLTDTLSCEALTAYRRGFLERATIGTFGRNA